MFLTFMEIFDMVLMIAVVGFVFMNAFKMPKVMSKKADELEQYLRKSSFNWDNFWFAAMVTAPAIILHEVGHKIMALSFGLGAQFHAAYIWLTIAIVMRLINLPFIFFVPAFVSVIGSATPGEHALIAFAGPGVNLLIFIISWIVLKTQRLGQKGIHFWALTKNINLFLFIFNMIPIPGFDGFQIFDNIFRIF